MFSMPNISSKYQNYAPLIIAAKKNHFHADIHHSLSEFTRDHCNDLVSGSKILFFFYESQIVWLHEENLSQEKSHGKSGLSSVMVFYLGNVAGECHKHHNQASGEVKFLAPEKYTIVLNALQTSGLGIPGL